RDADGCVRALVIGGAGGGRGTGRGVVHRVGAPDLEIGRAQGYAPEPGGADADLLLGRDGRLQDLVRVRRVDRGGRSRLQTFHVAREQRQIRQHIEEQAERGRGDRGRAPPHAVLFLVSGDAQAA